MRNWLSVLAVTVLMTFTACELEDKNLSPSDNTDGVCKLASGESIDFGQSVEAPDGCNTCSCDEAGNLACTEMACLDEDPTDKEEPGELTACTMDYTPVCGYDEAGNTETYSNACVAKSKSIVKTYEGECKEELKDKVDIEKFCTFKIVEKEVQCITTPCEPVEEKVYFWIAIEPDTKIETVDLAFCESEIKEEDKLPVVDACFALWAPVCAKTTEGELKTFGNDCEAGLAKAEIISEGECAVASAETKEIK